MEQLEFLHQNDPLFRGKLNLNKVGFMGHSMGGMAASRACNKSEKCGAFLSIEAAASGDVRKLGLSVPTGLLISNFSLSIENDSYRDIYLDMGKSRSNDFHLFVLSQSGHNSFTDLPLIAPRQFNYQIEALEGIRISREIGVNFFEATLLGKKEKLFKLPDLSSLLNHTIFESKD